MLQLLEIPEWKWEEITTDYVSGLSRSSEGYDSIWVIVDQMTKLAYFLHVKTIESVNKLFEGNYTVAWCTSLDNVRSRC